MDPLEPHTEWARRFGRNQTGERRKDPAGNDADGIPRNPQDRRSHDITWIPLFGGAPDQLVEQELQECEVLELPAGWRILVPGQTNDCVYIPLSGDVAAHLDYERNPAAAVPIKPGECIGELSAIDGKPVSALVVTVTAARVLRIPQEIFWDRLMVLPGVAANFRIMLSERVRKTSEMAQEALRKQLELEQLKRELQMARQLQASMLPLQRPLFPERSDLDVCGLMEPASNVGGDLFDAFFIRENQLFFCIGDVSGHGVASAMFMARAIGLLRVLAMATTEPHKLMRQLNERLCIGNDTNIFVTLLCGVMDVSSGQIRYSNGGHCPPMLVAPGVSRMLPVPKGPLVGAIPGARYSAMELTLQPGETFFCYTDGVTEAQDEKQQEYTEPRCLDFVNRQPLQDTATLLDAVRREVAAYTRTEVLEDDFTLFALRRL